MELCRKSIYQILYTFSLLNNDFVFIENDEEKYTIGEFFNTVCHTANELYSNGIRKNDIVALSCRRDIETIIYFLSLQILGAVSLMVDSHDDLDKIEDACNFKIKYKIFDNRSVTKANKLETLLFNEVFDPRDTTIAISTSGSTGDRKIIKMSQYAFINNAYDSSPAGWYETSDIALAFLPLNHVFAIAMLFTAMCFHFKVVVANCTDVPYLMECIDKYKITRFNSVPTLLLKMVELKGAFNCSSLKCAYIAGAPCSERDFIKIEKTLGIKLIPVYGMSECIGISTGSYLESSSILANSVGKKYSMNDVKISSDGEIMVKGPMMCNGYFNGDLELVDGYLPTGDLGEFDKDGYLHITGRKKEIIIRNGLNISINDISKKINDANCFKDYAVVGIKDEKVGEAPALAVVLKSKMDFMDIFVTLKKFLNKQEMPSRVVCLDNIPLLENGKVDKESIKKMFI